MMASTIDPQGTELRALLEAADFNAARVLEIGCGSGRLALRYAQRTRFVIGIEPKSDELRSAVVSRPKPFEQRLRFIQADATTLPFKGASFDAVLFAWSL